MEGLLLLAQAHRDEDPPGLRGWPPRGPPPLPHPTQLTGSSAALSTASARPRGSSWMSPSHPWHPPLGQAPAPCHPRLCCRSAPHLQKAPRSSPDSDPVPKDTGLCPTLARFLTAASEGRACRPLLASARLPQQSHWLALHPPPTPVFPWGEHHGPAPLHSCSAAPCLPDPGT